MKIFLVKYLVENLILSAHQLVFEQDTQHLMRSQITPRCRPRSDLMPIRSATCRGRRIDVGPSTILRRRAECVKSVSGEFRFDAIGPTRQNRYREEVGKTSGRPD